MLNLTEYIENLTALNPTKEELAKTESSYLLADEYSSIFTLSIVRPERLDASNPVLSIIESCDVSTFKVFIIRFSDQVEEIVPYQTFGNKEADDLVIHEETDEVARILYTVFYEYKIGKLKEIEEEYITPAASSQENFLKALYFSCALQSRIIKEKITLKPQDIEARRTYADQCTEAAGGERYRSFWYHLLSCLK